MNDQLLHFPSPIYTLPPLRDSTRDQAKSRALWQLSAGHLLELSFPLRTGHGGIDVQRVEVSENPMNLACEIRRP